MSNWKPQKASSKIEELMEERNVPEEDKNEIRRFSEFLLRRKAKKEGKEPSLMSEEMKKWLLGDD